MSGSENFKRVYSNGARARANGLPLSACPYRDYRKADGRITFSRAYRNAWRDGWMSVGPCQDCNGTGEVPAIGPEDGERDGYVTCQACHGKGVE